MFDQRWQANGQPILRREQKRNADDDRILAHAFKDFPREYALEDGPSPGPSIETRGSTASSFPLAMSRQSMKIFASKVDHSFGYTPDTAYFTLDGMFRQRLGEPAWQLTLNHLQTTTIIPTGIFRSLRKPTHDRRTVRRSVFELQRWQNAAVPRRARGLEYSIPENPRRARHDAVNWEWMEVRIPIQMPGEQETRWPVIRFDRSKSGQEITKSIRVTDCPLRITIEPWGA